MYVMQDNQMRHGEKLRKILAPITTLLGNRRTTKAQKHQDKMNCLDK